MSPNTVSTPRPTSARPTASATSIGRQIGVERHGDDAIRSRQRPGAARARTDPVRTGRAARPGAAYRS
jgi:hypothetical protein